ncbi:TetR/AcrR family transcriptional regulator [Gloeobacter kilaueensis]|uniref:TetR family transcriptional regulator n=1 Tax=Gloeobacter kilaueensis (strain ATCC BAA-2537 / CCAP 1431/1 / ULC 316 / JS1) TaxID=1183438 RepID=U5QJ57_GLOK1|nr:TetR/AcrR family transcriptional regulator [Gloeobacter kilaueensis]AGY57715.1 TetR family transcriptional regulator [Gloeobacter kilaueensis JS1]
MKASIREKTALLRRQHILEAAIRVFADRGFQRATIREIANEAGVSDGTIYNSFKNKADLLLAVLDPLDEVGRAVEAPLTAVSDDVEQLVRQLFRRRWETFTPEILNVLRAVFSEVLINEELRALYVDRVLAPALTLPEPLFKNLVAAGKLRPIDVSLTLRTITATFLGLVTLRLLGDEYVTAHWDAVPDELAALFLAGILPQKTERGGHESA